ncbi:cell division protein PerM [Streptomyces sp. NPDC055287]
MTQVTHRGTWLPSAHSRSSVQAACFVRGVIAAGLGLGSLAVLVMVLWISSPYPDSGPGGALRLAAGLWLLAHGVELVRYDTLSGGPAPVGLTPMLLIALPLWLTHRAARDAMDGEGDEEGEGEGSVGGDGRAYGAPGDVASAGAAFLGVVSGYVGVGVFAVFYAHGGPLPAGLVSAAVHLPLVAAAGAAGGVWTANGRPRGPLPGWVPGGAREALVRPWLRVALRAAGAGVVALTCGGSVLALASLVWHAGAAQGAVLQLAGDWSGRLAVLLLVLALAPNAAVWAAAYGLGPGFALGAGATAAPLGVVGPPALPHFPLVAALPAGEAATPVHWATLAVPVVGAGAVAWFTVRTAAPPFAVREEAWTLRETAATAALAGSGCGMAMAVLAALAAGPLGVGALAEFGPVWWRTGGAAVVWTVTLGVPAALILRVWRLRDRTPRSWRRAARAEAAAAREAGPAKRGWWRRGSAEEPRLVREAEATVGGGRRGWWRRGSGPESGAQQVEEVANGAKRGWWRRGREVAAVTDSADVAPWWRPGGRGSVGDDVSGPYDSEADFLPIGDPGATVGVDWRDSGVREVRWATLKESSGGPMAGFPAAPAPHEPQTPGPQARRDPGLPPGGRLPKPVEPPGSPLPPATAPPGELPDGPAGREEPR